MKQLFTKHLATSLALMLIVGMMPVSALASGGTEPVAIHLIGDSTVCMYPESSFPRWGWGQAIPLITNKNVAVFDWAMSGHSTRTFYDENPTNHTWPQIINSIEEGDYLFIQFGHNDQKDYNDEYKNTVYAPLEDQNIPGYKTYEYYLRNFISETKAKGAHPIIVTPIERLNVLKESLEMGPGSLEYYAAAAKKVATDEGVPYIDLRALQRAQLAAYTNYNDALQLYMASHDKALGKSKENWDYTHLTKTGATLAARMVFGALKEQGHPLGAYLLDEGTYNAGSAEFYVNETFDGKQVRGPLVKPLEYDREDGKLTNDGNYWTTSLETEDSNKYLKFSVDVTEKNTYLNNVNAVIDLTSADGSPKTVESGGLAFEYDVKFPVYDEAKGNTVATSMLIDSEGSPIHQSKIVNSAAGAELVSNSGKVYSTISSYDGKWINVKNVLNLDTGLCLTYYNGTLATKKFISNTSTVSKIKFSGVPIGQKYNEVSFDNIKVYATTAPSDDDPALDSAIDEVDYIISDDFNWIDYETVTVGDRSLVYHSPSSIGAQGCYHNDLKNASSSYTLTTEIVTDTDPGHGKVLKLSTPATSWSGRRGINMFAQTASAADASKNFRVFEFDFKVLGGEGYNPENTSIYTAYADMHNFLKLSEMTFLATTKKFKDYEDLAYPSIGEFSAELSDDTNLKSDTWYTVRYLFDRTYRQYDMFINDVLVAQDCDMPIDEAGASGATDTSIAHTNTIFTIGIGASGADTKAFCLDNVRAYDVTDDTALSLAKKGVEKYIGNEVYSYSSTPRKFTKDNTMQLPFAGITGFNYYASSTNPGYDGKVHTPHKSYTWSIPDGSDLVVEHQTFDWAGISTDPSKPPYTVKADTTPTYKVYETWNINYDTEKRSNAIGYARVKLNDGVKMPSRGSKDLTFNLTANIKKGSATGSVTKKIVLQRPVLNTTPAGIIIGEPAIGTPYRQHQTQSLEASFKSFMENSTAKDYVCHAIIGFYDENDVLVYTSFDRVVIPAGGSYNFQTWINPVRVWLGNVSDNNEFVKVDDGGTSEFFTKEELDAARAIDQTIKYTKAFLWSAEYAPFMEGVPKLISE